MERSIAKESTNNSGSALFSSSATANHQFMTFMNELLQNSVSDDSNKSAFDHGQRNRANSVSRMDSFVPSYHQSNEAERLLYSVQGSVSWLIVNQPKMFQELLDLCEDKRHVELLVAELFLDSKQVIELTFTKQGSTLVQKLVEKIKHMPHAFELTELIATRFYEMATHNAARFVILKCFNVFGVGPNDVLYRELIRFHRKLATDIVGCSTLNKCIDSISGDYRKVLLVCIAKFSDYLASDPSGSFVVQHVLELRNNEVNDVILEKLKGQFVTLAQKYRSSRVVEKCMEVSENGLVAVVNEMLQSRYSLCSVAKDKYGSYVVQKALDMTNRKGHVELYESLVKNLMHQTKKLERTLGGRHVISVLRCGKSTAGKCNNSC